MKKISVCLLFFCLSVYISAQDFATFFLNNNNTKKSELKVVNVSDTMLSTIAQAEKNKNNNELKTLIQSISSIRIITSISNGKTHYENAKKQLEKQSAHKVLVSIDNNGGKSVRIFAKSPINNIASEVNMLMLEGGKMTLVNISGKINLNKLSENLSILIASVR